MGIKPLRTENKSVGMKIIRVFPTRTNLSPVDSMAFYGLPPFPSMIPDHDEVHISTVFTWDKERAKMLARNWQAITDRPVLVGGPAYGDIGGEFVPGRYIAQGVTITSRGCPNVCPKCLVPTREGKIRELNISPGRIIQDNNVLACSRDHIDRVLEMLKTQSRIKFSGGLEAKRVTPDIAAQLKTLRIDELWLACDVPSALNGTIGAIERLTRVGFRQDQIRCYVLIGFDMDEEEYRLTELLKAGCLPFAQLYQPESELNYNRTWKHFARKWSRPAIYKTQNKGVV